jgi:hypothetical protein
MSYPRDIDSNRNPLQWFREFFTGFLSPVSWAGTLILVVPLLLFGVIAFLFFSESAQIIATTFLINLIAVLGYFTFIGTTGVGVFGHVAFTGIAAHLVALLTLDPAIKARILPNLPYWLAQAHFGFWSGLLLTVGAVGLFAFLIGIPFCRMKDNPVGLFLECFPKKINDGISHAGSGRKFFRDPTYGDSSQCRNCNSIRYFRLSSRCFCIFMDCTTGLL